jgi:hypothetical protein
VTNPFSIHLPDYVDRKAYQVCSTAGINLLQKEKARFVDLAKTLQASIEEIGRAKKLEEFASVGLLGANLIKASCDAFIDMAGTLGELAGVKGAGKASTLIGAGSQTAEFWINKAYGQETDAIGTASSIGKAALALAPGGKGVNGEIGKKFAEMQLVKVDIINAAVKNDKPKALRETFLSYAALVSSMVFTALKKEAAEKLTSSYAAMVKAGATYSENLEKAFGTRLSDEERLQALARQRKVLTQQLSVAMSQIQAINSVINDCRKGAGLRLARK